MALPKSLTFDGIRALFIFGSDAESICRATFTHGGAGFRPHAICVFTGVTRAITLGGTCTDLVALCALRAVII